MNLVFSPLSKFPGRGPCIELYGDWVTERVWNIVKRVVGTNLTTSEWYQARQDFSVFFQGGHNDPKGKWILLEFWTDHLERTREFVRLLNIALNDAIIPNFTKLRVNAYNMGYDDGKGALDVMYMIGKETGCPIDWGCSMSPVTFMPEDNLQSTEVQKLCMLFDLNITPWEDPGI